MKPRAEENKIAIPPSLLKEIQAAAEEEKRPAEEVLREAIERYLENRRWQRILAYGQQRARELGLTEADVPRLIAESRRERAQERSK
jgi:predicted transcriptional regulator